MESPIFEDFLTMAFKKKMSINLDNIDFEYHTSAAKLLNKRKELKETEELLLAKKNEFNERMKKLEERKNIYNEKQKDLENNMKIYDQDFKDILSKRERAAKRYDNEFKIRRSKEEEIEEKSVYLKNLVKERSLLQAQAEEKSMYKKFLDTVVDAADDFQEINDVIQRHGTLLTTKAELQKIANISQTLLMEEKQKMSEILENNGRTVLLLNNEIASLQKEFEESKSNVVQLEETWNKIRNASTKDALLAGQIKYISHNLYNVINDMHRMPTREDEEIFDTLRQLEKVQEYLQQLKEVAHEVEGASSDRIE